MLSPAHYDDLESKGYTVVPNVLSVEECDTCILEYKDWLSQFAPDEWCYSSESLIQRYNVGHFKPTWTVRLKCKPVFAQIWKTDKLLTSFDAIAIGRPPENSVEHFSSPNQHWLHIDQESTRRGLHAYQGGVSLEHAEQDDWTFEVLQGSHVLFTEFMESDKEARFTSELNAYYRLRDDNVEWYVNKGCELKRVAVPKGAIALWDSRLVHANARPIKGRHHPGRWRYTVFVSMTPAMWAGKEDLDEKLEAYNEVLMTTHWSSQEVSLFLNDIPSSFRQDVTQPTELPENARTDDAKRLSGVIPYDFTDGSPNGPEVPTRVPWVCSYCVHDCVCDDQVKPE
jgi:hypothetical protein